MRAALLSTGVPVVVAALTAMVGAASASNSAYRDSPPPGFSGGFGEQSCHACHFHNEPDDGAGSVTIRGVPERYSAGAAYPISVVVTRPGIAVAGFQLTARFVDDGMQAGSLVVVSDDRSRVGITVSHGVTYAHHVRAGSEPSVPDSATWTLVWIAPESVRAVSFHAAANAADGDDAVDGDFVYTTVVETIGVGRH